MKQTAKNIKMLRSLSYSIYKESKDKKISAEVSINRVRPLPVFDIAQVKLKGMVVSDEGALSIAFASDGSKFEFLDPKSGDMVRIDSPTISKVARSGLMEYGLLVLGCYTQEEPMDYVFKTLQSVEQMGDTIIYGVNTVKLKVLRHFNDVFGDRVDETYWYVGKTDGLVRGICYELARYSSVPYKIC